MGGHTNATHGMTLAAVSMAYYHHILPFGLPKFKRYAINVWNVNPEGKTDEAIALEGLDRMKDFMVEIGLVMSLVELGVKVEMLEGIAKGTFILEGGYKVLTQEEVGKILKESL